MPGKVFVTGIGLISAIGKNAGEGFAALIESRHGIAPVSFLETSHKDMAVGEVKYSNGELTELLSLKNRKYITRTSLLGLLAATEAFYNASLPSPGKLRIGFISATSVGGMDRSENFYINYLHNHSHGRLRDVISHECGESTERIASQLGIRNHVATISTACSSSANAIMLGARMIKNNLLDVVIAGGTDALVRFTLNGFNTLMILDKQHCRPFDETRTGLNLGEGAGYIVLESGAHAEKRKATVLAELTGYGNANDAYHQTASSPEGYGAVLAMNKAFNLAGITPSAISYVNAHGTGTPNNDLSEGKAIEQVFGGDIPPVSSTKAFTGHTLGAAGGIEAVFSVLSIMKQVTFPNLNFKNQMKELNFKPVTSVKNNITINHVLSNSFGFGGNNSSLIFSKI